MSSQLSLCSRPKTLTVHMFHDNSELESVQFKINEKHFMKKDFSFILKELYENGKCVLKLSVAPLCNSEWELMYQMRVKTGLSSSSLQIVDKTVVQFTPTSNGISFELLDDIKLVNFELRTINEFNLTCPTFDQGDVFLRLSDGTHIRTYKSLLLLSSEALRETVSKYPSMNCFDLTNLPRNAVIQYLYRLYPNRRGFKQNFEEIALTSVVLGSRVLISKLSEYMCSSVFKPASISERLKIALKLRLIPAIKTLTMKLVKNGEWEAFLNQNSSFFQTFPVDVYNTLILPIITQKEMNDSKAKEETYSSSAKEEIDFFSASAAADPQNCRIIFLDTVFYINKGVMIINGTEEFERLSDGSFGAKFSKSLQRECALVKCMPGEVLRFLLSQMYPGGPQIPLNMERAALVFCFDHKWTKMSQILEQAYMRNPCTSRTNFFLSLTLADELDLQNLMRRCMLYAEGSCNQFARELISSPDFYKITENTRRVLVDHVYCGWSVESLTKESLFNRLAIRAPSFENEREIGYRRGGPKGHEDDRNTDYSFDI